MPQMTLTRSTLHDVLAEGASDRDITVVDYKQVTYNR